MHGFIDYIKKIYGIASKKCIYCGSETDAEKEICGECLEQERKLKGGFSEETYHVFEYDGIVREMIHKLKYGSRPYLSFYMAKKCVEFIKENNIKADMITFVPVHKKRKASRGFDQCEMIAIYISAEINIPFETLLKRVKNTKPQFSLDIYERKMNMKSAFLYVGNNNIEGKKVLVFDDIFTTGATMEECCRTIKEKGGIPIKFTYSK